MKVSIITATYNSEKTIQDTLTSLFEQTYSNIEYIVIDGGSSDKTLSIIQESKVNLSKIISEPDQGIYDALNKGINLATGDVVGFLHSDDVFAYSDAIRDLVEKFEQTGTDAVYADLEYVAKNDPNKVIRKWISGNYKSQKLSYGWMPPHPTFFMKRELYEKYGLFDLNFKISADYDSILRYLWINKIKVAYLPKIFTKMRMGGASNSCFSNIIKKSQEDIKALKKNDLFWPTALFIKNFSKAFQFVRR